MKNHTIYSEIDNSFKILYCNFTEIKKFKDKLEYDTFVKMHPSSVHVLKKIEADGAYIAEFGMFGHSYWNSSNVTTRYAYNANASDEIDREKYYKLKAREKEIKNELETLQKLSKTYEA